MQFRERGGHPCLCTNCEPPLFILQQLKGGNNGKLASILDVICFSLDSRDGHATQEEPVLRDLWNWRKSQWLDLGKGIK